MFNLIGPLANPIRPDFQIIGVSGATQASLVSEALLQLGTKRAAIVHGEDGLDEVTLGDHTSVHWIENDSISTKKWLPSDFGLPMTDASELRVTGPEESATQILAMLQGQEGPVRSSVLANSAAALLVCGKVESLRDGVRLSSSAIDSGKAMKLLERWRVLSQIAPSAETH
jgi:anthranilate phosphoribosyltransferase